MLMQMDVLRDVLKYIEKFLVNMLLESQKIVQKMLLNI